MATLSSSSLLLSAIVLPLFILAYQYILHPAFGSPLRKIPAAHWSCHISPAWILWARFGGRENRTLYTAHKQHGPIVRIGPNELSINSIEGVKTVYQGGFDKHQWYSVFDNYGVPCMFSSVHSKHHSIRKRMVSNVYSKSYINSSPSLAAQSDVILNSRLVPLLESSMSESQIPHGVDVHSLFSAVAMDFISAYCFGIRHGANFIQNKALRDHWLCLYSTRKGYGFFAQELPRLSRALGSLGISLTPAWVAAANRELETWCKKHSDAAIRHLQEPGPSSANSADDPVVVRALLSGFEKEEKANGPDSPIYSTAILQPELSVASEVLDHVLAGQETTGVALTYLSHHLSQSPDLQRQLRAELLSLRPDMRLQGGRMAMPDSKQLDGLPVLDAVITETVRRYTPAGGPEPRVTPAPSCRIGPYEVPGGVRVSASAFNLHRDEKAFPDPETWDHTRWLPGSHGDGDGNKKRKDIRRQFWGFSSGGRMCLGSNFAMHDMKLTVAAIYTNYTSHVVDDRGAEPTDAYTGHPRSNSLYLRFERVAES
ncbi:cytochrome P450 3A12 [Biscogniauxia mediterranea]|nr:cytochrome P450 3A12 [Biscogniauxia mediterranea]